ncbi:sensor histidine kinase [Leucobacter insecticola]|uniref:histidine kinase n=1 Tax=Leucobacter insecticola TaxID=2714934 RepID=A0A6G8FLA8_9MICO|nr:sensor histidine kinase [Leucobacter insecticola]QIM17128.1 sensor histidine kinase [Leucobacter insecticola]
MKNWSIATRLFVGQLCLVLVAVSALAVALTLDAKNQAEREAQDRMLSLSAALAVDPFVIESVQSPDPTALLQPFAQSVMEFAAVDYVTIMDTEGTRYTHRYLSEIGGTFAGPIAEALAGHAVNQMRDGPLGPTIRGIAPVRDADGKVIALVSTGVTVARNNSLLVTRIPLILAISSILLVGGAFVALGLRRYLNRVTLGQGPEEIAQMYALYDAVLHTVDDGMLLLGRDGKLVLHNDRARELLGLSAEPAATSAAGDARTQIPEDLINVLAGGDVVDNEVVSVGDRILLVSRREVRPERGIGAALGTVVVLRDRTELLQLSTELDTVHTMADALRAQTHEHANKLHTMVTLVELGRGEEAVRFAASDLRRGEVLADQLLDAVEEPAISALLLGKSAQAEERDLEFSVVSEGRIRAGALDPHDAVTILGNLIDNAMDAAAEQESPDDRWVEVELIASTEQVVCVVSDGGAGLGGASSEEILRRGYTSKRSDSFGRGIGLALVAQAVRRARGTLHFEDGASRGQGTRCTVVLPMQEEE